MPHPARFTIASLLGVALAAVLVLAPGVARAGPALVFDVRTGEVLHSHQPFQQWYPASLTKLMTAYVTFRAIREGRAGLDTPVRVSARALAEPPSKMGFPVGTTLSIDYAMRILMVKSANDIAVALAETVGGNLETFIAQMNASAARLGMTDTRFFNPHGLPDDRQITTARDIGLLARALITEFPQYQFYFEAQSIRVGQTVMSNHNKLIGRFAGADGLKTGYICKSGFNLAASATRNGRRIVAIVLGSHNARYREQVAGGLLEAAFDTPGGGFRLFGSSRTRLHELPRPAGVQAPVDMCPYVRGRQMPAHIASFGTDATGRVAGGEAAGNTRLLSNASVAPLGSQSAATPVRAFAVPLPRSRPVATAETAASAAVTPGTMGRASEVTVPMPDPMRSPLH